jgi:GntR family transcriptional regulator
MWSEIKAMAADRFLTRPLYRQVRDALVDRIATGVWKPGGAIPNEGDLAREFGVSPGTMRKALDQMEAEHLVTRRQGRGTFVNDQSSNELAVRFDNIRGRDGERIIGNVTSAEMAEGEANEMECMRLCLPKGDRVYRIRRVGLFENKPFMLEEASVPAAQFPGLEEMSSFQHRIVLLAQKHGILLGKAEERISLALASREVAKALSIAPVLPVAVLDRVVWSIDGRPVEWRMAWCHLNEYYYLAQIG